MTAKELLSKAVGVEVTSKRGGRAEKTVSIVLCDNGKRLTMSASLFEALGQPDEVKCAVIADKRYLIIASDIESVDTTYTVSNKGKGIIYNAELVRTIAETFSLDFSNKTSMSFNKVKLEDVDGVVTAFVKIK